MNRMRHKYLIVLSILLCVLIITLHIGFHIHTPKPTYPVPIGFGAMHIIDGYHVVYEEDWEATWIAQHFQLRSDATFHLSLRCDYLWEEPRQSKVYYSPDNIQELEVNLDYVGSAILMQVLAQYRLEPFGDSAVFFLTEQTALVPKSADAKSVTVEYSGNFLADVNVTRVKKWAYEIDFTLQWIRVFTDRKDGTLYYQWMQSWVNFRDMEKLEIDKALEISGSFLAYYPIPENVTSPLVPTAFDYVRWIRENIL